MGVVSPERTPRAPEQPPARPPEPPPRRDVPWGLIALGLVVLAIVWMADRVAGFLPDFDNPFATETVERGGPAVLKSIRDIGEYRAASGDFEVIVDLEEDTGLPDEILGERTLFVAVGDVDASVDLGGLGQEAVDVAGTSVSVTLPPPRLSEPRLDLERSYVYSRERGILNELGDLFRDERNVEREVYLAAEEKIASGAQSAGILRRAERLRPVGALPGEVVLGPAEVAVRGRPREDRAPQVEVAQDRPGPQVEVLAHELLDPLERNPLRTEALHLDGHRVSNADCIRDLELEAIG